MKKLLLSFAIVALVSGCQKDPLNSTPTCETNNQGTLSVRSIQNESYRIYLNGGYKGSIGAAQTVNYSDIAAGTYTFQAKEIDYVFVQDVFSASVTITRCETYQVNF